MSAQISISPDSFTISAYPGQNITRTITVEVDGEQNVFFNDTSSFIEIFPKNVTIDEEGIVNLIISFASNVPLGSLSFKITGYYEAEDEPTIFKASQSEIQEGFIETLKEKDQIEFRLIQKHKLKVNKIGVNEAFLLIESDPINLIVFEDTERSVCLDKSSGEAIDLRIGEISDEEIEIEIKKSECKDESKPGKSIITGDSIKIIPEKSDKDSYLFLGIISALVLGMICFFLIRKTQKKD